MSKKPSREAGLFLWLDDISYFPIRWRAWPEVFGERMVKKVPMAWVRRGASLLFAIFGTVILLKV